MTITAVEQALFDHLARFADGRGLRVRVEGKRFSRRQDETFLFPTMINGAPTQPNAGAAGRGRHKGTYQIAVSGPEKRRTKAFMRIGEEIAAHFWPDDAKRTPTIGTAPVVLITPARPHVYRNPAARHPGEIVVHCDIPWRADI